MRFGRAAKAATPPCRKAPAAKDGWQIVYTGFVLIMLCFFIMLTSFASLDASKITRFANSFSHAVNVLGGGRSIETGGAIQNGEISLLSKADLKARLFARVRQICGEEGLVQSETRMAKQGVILRLKDSLLFDSASATLSDEAYPLLVKIGHIIQEVGVPVEIQGHTDDRPINTRQFPSNWELSTARAVAVLRYLTQSMGLPAERLAAVGFAAYRPLVANDNADHRARNRRVDLIFQVESE